MTQLRIHPQQHTNHARHLPTARSRRAISLAGLLGAFLLLLGGCQASSSAPLKADENLVGRAHGSPVATRHGALWYQIALSGDELRVHVRLLDPPERTAFFMPGEWAGHNDYAQAIEIRGAQTPDGPTTYTIDRGAQRVDIPSRGQPWVQLDYAVRLTRTRSAHSRFHPNFIDQLLFAYGPAFLMLPSDQIMRAQRDIPIEVRAPQSWKLLSTWTPMQRQASSAAAGMTVHGFLAETPAALRDAFLTAGPQLALKSPTRHAYTTPGTVQNAPEAPAAPPSLITLGFDPALAIDQDHFSQQVAHILTSFRHQFGDLGPVHALVRRPFGDAQTHRGVGRRGGFVVEISPDALPTLDPTSPALADTQTLILLAHEAFHLWNGHYLTAQAAWEPQTRWFKEGVTHYVALKTLARLGLLTRDALFAELLRSAEYYARNPARSPHTRARAGDLDHARLPYDRGVLLALAIDTFLSEHPHKDLPMQSRTESPTEPRTESPGEPGIEIWIERLLTQLAAHQQGYAPAHLRAAFLDVSADAPAAATFWDRLVDEQTALDPTEIFAFAGLHWLQESPTSAGRLLPIKSSQPALKRLFPFLRPDERPANGGADAYHD